MSLEYVKIPIGIFVANDLNDKQKILLGMVASFKAGLKLNNATLAKLFQIRQGRISELLTDMERKDYVQIKNRQSKYRIVYLQENTKVENLLLSISTELLSDLDCSTFDQSRNINKRSKIKKNNSSRPSANLMADDGYTRFKTHPATPNEVAKLEREGIL